MDGTPSSHHVVEASLWNTQSSRYHRKRLLTYNALLTVTIVMVYHAICSFLGPMLQPEAVKGTGDHSVSLTPRDGLEERSSGDDIWDQIASSPTLEWRQCYDEFRCARLEVPLDYWNSTPGTVVLAIAMLPAKVPITDPRYGGPILVNTGGPGVASTAFAVAAGSSIQNTSDPLEAPSSTVGNESARYYDVVGIDPRGVGFSLPSASCFGSDIQRAEWNLRIAAMGILGSSDTAVSSIWGQWRAYGLACDNLLQSENVSSNIMPYITTASTARDMITFVDVYAEWREVNSNSTLKHQVRKNERRDEKERVQYVGYSWGTFLGMTFASMFPERTGRLVLDAVVDTDDYLEATWTVSVTDSEKTVSWFYSSCAEVGPNLCALAKPNSTAEEIRARVESILSYLYQNPVASTGMIPNLLTWSDVRGTQMLYTYEPRLWGSLATTLAALENATSSPIAAAAAAANYPVPGNISAPLLNVDAEAGIACGDAFPQESGNFTLADARAHWEKLRAISPTMAATFAPLRYMCAAWHPRALYAYRGPFGSSADSGVPPPLFVANTADPVTPIASARKMVQRFSGARLLTLDMPGHSSLALASTCREAVVRAYMQGGEVGEGIVCQPSETPFQQ